MKFYNPKRFLILPFILSALLYSEEINYLDIIRECLVQKKEFSLSSEGLKQEFAETAHYACTAIQYGFLVKDEDNIKTGTLLLEKVLTSANAQHQKNKIEWKLLTPIAKGIYYLKKNNRLSRAMAAAFRTFALNQQAFYTQRRPMDHGNRTVTPVAGGAYILKVYPNDNEFSSYRKYINEYWEHQLTVPDLDENAGTYNALGVSSFIRLGFALGKKNDLLKYKNMFYRYRRYFSPTGFFPEYGDDYFRVMKSGWLYIFEVAARIFRDPSFIELNKKILSNAYNNIHLQDTVHYKLDYYHGILDLLEDKRLKVSGKAVSFEHSTITFRANHNYSKTPDKMILCPDRKPGSPMIFIDLYARGDHSHKEKRASIGYYEVDHVPLFHNYTRFSPSAYWGNQIYIAPAGDKYPSPLMWQKSWTTGGVPLDRFSGSQKNQKINLRNISLACRSDKKPLTILLDNIRLVGTAGTKIIEGFENSPEWENKGPTSDIIDNDEIEGKKVLKLTSNAGTISSPMYNISINLQDYQYLRYDYKCISDFKFTKIDKKDIVQMRFSGSLTDSSHNLNSRTTMTTLENQTLDMKNGDSLGTLYFPQYYSHDTPLQRQVLLTKEGILVLRDKLEAGSTIKGFQAGSLWHLYNYQERGTNWFFSGQVGKSWGPEKGPQYRKGMLVYYATNTGRVYDIEQKSNAMHGLKNYFVQDNDSHITYCKEIITSAKPMLFTTVIIPVDPEIDPSKIAGAIKIHENMDLSIIYLKLNNTYYKIKLHTKGDWQVLRSSTEFAEEKLPKEINYSIRK